MIKDDILDRFKGVKVERNSFSIKPVTIYKKGEKPRISGYEATRTVTLVTQDFDSFSRVLYALTSNSSRIVKQNPNAIRVSGVDFSLRDNKVAEMSALENCLLYTSPSPRDRG